MKLSSEILALEMAASGLPRSEIARHVGCSSQAVSRLIRRAYASVQDDEPDGETDSATQAKGQEADRDLG